MIRSKLGQRLFGLLLLALGGALTVWNWYTVLTLGYYYMYAAAIGPVFAVLGLGMALFPIDVEQQLATYGSEKPRGWNEYPASWKVALVVAVAAGLGNWLLLHLQLTAE
jgi:hypothetical protein